MLIFSIRIPFNMYRLGSQKNKRIFGAFPMFCSIEPKNKWSVSNNYYLERKKGTYLLDPNGRIDGCYDICCTVWHRILKTIIALKSCKLFAVVNMCRCHCLWMVICILNGSTLKWVREWIRVEGKLHCEYATHTHTHREMLQNYYWIRWNRLIGVYYLPSAIDRSKHKTHTHTLIKSIK